MVATRSMLGVLDRDRVWRSSRNQAEYRWHPGDLDSADLGTWEVKTSVADWHPARPGGVRTVYAQAGEKFLEVS